MAKVNSTQFAEKWARRMSQSTQDIQNGVNRVTEAPTAKAAAKKQKMLQNLTAAVNSGKWEAGLNRVTLQDWKKSIIEKGLPRVQAGVTAAQPKVAEFATKLLSYQDNLQSQIESMPDLTLQDSIARMTAWVTGMSKFER